MSKADKDEATAVSLYPAGIADPFAYAHDGDREASAPFDPEEAGPTEGEARAAPANDDGSRAATDPGDALVSSEPAPAAVHDAALAGAERTLFGDPPEAVAVADEPGGPDEPPSATPATGADDPIGSFAESTGGRRAEARAGMGGAVLPAARNGPEPETLPAHRDPATLARAERAPRALSRRERERKRRERLALVRQAFAPGRMVAHESLNSSRTSSRRPSMGSPRIPLHSGRDMEGLAPKGETAEPPRP